MLTSKWKTLNRDCTKFNAFNKRAKYLEKSGENELDNMKHARKMYRHEHKGAPFNNKDVWEVLRAYKKWDAPEGVDLTGDVPSQTNEALFGQDAQPHTMGKKHASKKAKSGARQIPGERVPEERARQSNSGRL